MNKKNIFIVFALILLGISIGVYLYISKQKQSNNGSANFTAYNTTKVSTSNNTIESNTENTRKFYRQ